ncbi:MAG: hypothetical protein IKC88_00480, partial [Opitutales bacterium]|nr:hypothetical protein [Opitutales bacterium]
MEGAKFILSKKEDGSEAISISKQDGEMIFTVNESSDVTEIETDPTGEFEIRGLDEGVYYLFETKAPTGYNKLV